MAPTKSLTSNFTTPRRPVVSTRGCPSTTQTPGPSTTNCSDDCMSALDTFLPPHQGSLVTIPYPHLRLLIQTTGYPRQAAPEATVPLGTPAVVGAVPTWRVSTKVSGSVTGNKFWQPQTCQMYLKAKSFI